MIAWLLYAAGTAGLAGVSAAAAERVLRAFGRPGRGAWVSATVVSFALPLAALAGWSGLSLTTPGAGAVFGGGPLAEATGGLPPPLPMLAWALLSTVALAVLAGQVIRLRRRSGGWRPARITGVPVLVSPGTGPAVVGVIRPSIVVPHWLFDLDGRSRRLAVLHEQEHCRAGDVALLNGMALLVALAPWNPALWWQAARLHRAIELDCDARVLRRVRDRRSYGRMLLEAAKRSARPPRLAAALGRGQPLLERRIRTLLSDRGASRPVAAVLAAPLLLALACALPTPFEADANGESEARSFFRLVEDPLPSVRATVAPRAQADGGRAIYEMRELPREDGTAVVSPATVPGGAAGVLRPADPNDPRIRALEEQRPRPGGGGGVATLRERRDGGG